MLSSPLSITLDATPVSLPRISMGDMKGTFRSSSGDAKLTVSHTASKRERTLVRIDLNKIEPDPLNSAINRPYSCAAYLVIDAPLNGVGYTDAEIEDLVLALTGLIEGGTFLAQILGKEA